MRFRYFGLPGYGARFVNLDFDYLLDKDYAVALFSQ